jgi:DNA-directed RNA polymerase specialized sigma24 family protein
MEAVERELLEIRTRLDRLEQRVRQLAGEEPEIPPPTPGIPPDPQRLLAWLRAQGLIREPTPEERRLAAEWDALPEEVKEAIQRELDHLPPGPMASDIIIENRW